MIQLQHSRYRLSGFTFVELMMGIGVTSLVMLALSSVCMSVAAGWKQGELGRSTWMGGTGVTTQLQRTLREARYLGYVHSGDLSANPAVPATLVYWRADDLNGVPDGVPQIGELGLLEFDPSNRTLTRYEIKPTSELSDAQKSSAAEPLTYNEWVVASSVAGDLKAYLESSGAGRAQIIARDVTAAEFATLRADELNPTGQPVVLFQLRFRRGMDATRPGTEELTIETVERGSVTLRAPTTRPNNW